MNRIAFAALAVVVTVGCSSQKIDYDYAHEADFSKYKTYAWHEDDKDSLKAQNPLANERVMSAVDQQLSAKGLRKVGSDPDVYVTYHAQSKENMSLDTTTMGYGYGPGWGWGGFYGGGMMGMGSTTTQVRTYQTGTLVVDIWDAKAKELVWRGIGSDTISDSPQKNAKKIDSAMQQMFRHYPPRGN